MQNSEIIVGGIGITPLLKAHKSLAVALAAPFTELNRDASIQRFEFTFELTWKTLRRFLKYKGLEINNPRDVFREAATQGLISHTEEWFVFLDNRNQTTHTYDEKIAINIYKSLPCFYEAVTTLINKLQTYE